MQQTMSEKVEEMDSERMQRSEFISHNHNGGRSSLARCHHVLHV
jgi:hypothetical protein